MVAADTDTPRYNVLFVLDHFYPYVGGAETLFWELSRSLAAAGHGVKVITLREPGTARRESVDGIEILRVGTPPLFRRLLFILLAIPHVLRHARWADCIHAAGYASALPARLAAWWCRKPAVLSVYEVFGNQWQSLADVNRVAAWLLRMYERLILRLGFTRYVCISEFTRSRLLSFANVPATRTTVVYPSLDYEFWNADHYEPRPLRAELGLSPDAFVYLFFGRPGVSKGVENLIEAAAQVARELPGSRLVLLLAREPAAGYRRVVQRIERLGLANHVTVLQPVPRDKLPQYLLAADCVVVPSISEGFGYSAVEAATLGCRVIATSGHAVQEVLGDEVDLVPPRDAAALTAALLHIARTKPPVRETDNRYTIEAHVAGMLDVYGQIALKCRRP
jgi:D-inositol-3-phosphate glycosyltransferase